MNNTLPKVVACVTAYNAEKFISNILQSLKNQTYPNFQVLVSDDCSTDNTAAVIESIIKGDDRFILIKQKKNLGWIDHVNFLLAEAVNLGKYVFIAPHDDEIDTEYIQKLTGALEKNPAGVIAFGDLICNFVKGKQEIFRYEELKGCTDKLSRLKNLLSRKGKWWVAYRGIMRASTVKKIIPLKKNIFGEKEFILDWIWLVKLASYGEFIRVPEVIYTKSYKKTSISGKWKYSNINYISSMINCSNVLRNSPLTKTDQFKLQIKILIHILKYILRKKQLYSFVRRVKRKILNLF